MAKNGPVLALRRHSFASKKDISPKDVSLAAIATAFAENSPIFICGQTGSGKTTALVNILRTHALHERVVIIEDVDEMPCLSPTWIKLTARPPNLEGYGAVDIKAIFRETLRLAPDRIVVGEVRGSEASSLYQGILSGHGSVLTTLHIDEPPSLLLRLEQMSDGNLDWKNLFRIKPPVLIFVSRENKGQLQNIVRWEIGPQKP
jgi:pilus assembly protein CpaF